MMHPEDEKVAQATQRYSPDDKDEQRRAFVLVMVTGESDASTGEEILKKCRVLDAWLKGTDESSHPAGERHLKVV